jgi:outer membrane protein TolC
MNREESNVTDKAAPALTQSISASCPIRVAMLVACAVTFNLTCYAGGLMDVYNRVTSTDPEMKSVDFQRKAAAQGVTTQKLGYMPKLSVNAREGWTNQNIIESGNPVFPSGRGDFGRTRAQVELDQPLFDPTVKPSVEAARAKLRQAESRGALNIELQTQDIIQEYLRLARYNELISSVNRVIARLESEAASTEKSNDAKIATLGDVQSIKLSLAAMKRERSNLSLQQNRSLALLGVGPDVLRTATMNSDSCDRFSFRSSSSSAGLENNSEIRILSAEMDEFESQARLERRRSLPSISLYGQYGLFKDGGSIFGGALYEHEFETGIMLRWNVFDGGINRSKAKEYEYLKKAKEAELLAKRQENERLSRATKEILAQSRRSVAELKDIVEQSKVLTDSAARAYDAGKETYINSVNAYLSSEAAVREWINARHDLVMNQVLAKAQVGGWNKPLVEDVDRLFVSSK